MNPAPQKYKFLGCEILYREACHLAAVGPNVVDVEFLPKGLHDLETKDMVARVQAAVDATDANQGYRAVLLGYARCNDGLVGVTARDIPLVIPKAHDCITLLFGSRKTFQAYFNENPGTYYKSTGWVERDPEENMDRPAYGTTGVMKNLGLTETYEELVAKHGRENADYIIESLGGWENAYSRLCYIHMGLCDETPFESRAQDIARKHGWSYERKEGDISLLRKMFLGQWDDDFIVIPPGGSIVARNDENILGVK
ncbi:MAG: DUF1638 domain-containing protein [Phycisphaerae bacterium]|nr:DUF1638 domain-containing protein [Phycisphaerae bacterium]